MSGAGEGNYVLVSPVKNEERYLETTIQSVLHQTVKPSRWIIVDDGSRDRTGEIIKSYTNVIS
jgi:glycosyltransferase involved in cell wall biosynthesis